jgi:hypothetical protein
MDLRGPWVQDALNAIEYANGPTNPVWGRLRARPGHPEPEARRGGIGLGTWLTQAEYEDLRGAGKLGTVAPTLSLSSAKPTDENSLDAPTRVAPVAGQLPGA